MAGALKTNSNTSARLYSVQINTSLANTTIPALHGMRRVGLKLINTWNFGPSDQQGGKKGKSAKKTGVSYYQADMDYLIGFGPIWNLWDSWSNGTFNGYSTSTQSFSPYAKLKSQTFTVTSGDYTGPDALGNYTYSNTISTDGGWDLDGIRAISIGYTQTGTTNDYGDPLAPQAYSESVEQWLYNTHSGDNPGKQAWRPGNQALGVPLCNSASCDFGIGGDRTSDSFSITMPTAQAGTVTVYFGETESGHTNPISFLGYNFEAQLGSQAGSGGAPGDLTYPDFSGVYCPAQQLGAAATASNDELEAQGLYSLTLDGQCNPADHILDIVLSGNIYSADATMTPICWSHGLDFGYNPTQINLVDGSTTPGTFVYPPTLYFPYVVPGGIVNILEDSPVFVRIWDSSVYYLPGSIVLYTDSNYYQCKQLVIGLTPPDSSTYWTLLPEAPTLSDGLTAVRNYCTAYGIHSSLYMDSQRPASDWLTDICQVAGCVPVWTGSQLRFYPLCEQSKIGGGAVYTSPTASGPLLLIDDRYYVVSGAEPPVQNTQEGMQAVYNQANVTYADRNSTGSASLATGLYGYNQNSVTICDQQHAFTYGAMLGSPITLDHLICDAETATLVGWPIMKRQRFEDHNHYKFTLPVWACLLDPMDLITITDPYMFAGTINGVTTSGSQTQDVRICSLEEDDNYHWSLETERFLYGCHAPQAPSYTHSSPQTPPNPQVLVASVNTPYFFQPTALLTQDEANSLWIAVSDDDPNYGGCNLWVSTDGGDSYDLVGSSFGNPVMGVTYNSDYPDSTSPDTTDDLYVDLTESAGVLGSFTSGQQDQLVSLALLDSGTGGIAYELIAYGTVTLESASKYKLSAPILRGQVGSAHSDHPIGTTFVDLSPTSQTSIFKNVFSKLTIPFSQLVGQTLYFKFQTFNKFMAGLQDLSDCTAYSYEVSDVNTTGSTQVVSGTGSPEGVISAGVGSLYTDTSTTPATFYQKTSGDGNTGWVVQTSSLASDSDVDISSPANGDVLTYNSTASKWENEQPAAPSGGFPVGWHGWAANYGIDISAVHSSQFAYDFSYSSPNTQGTNAPTASEPATCYMTTQNTSGSIAYMGGGLTSQPTITLGTLGSWQSYIRLSQTTTTRCWVGLANDYNTALFSNDPTGKIVAAFRYSTSASDTHWQAYCANNTGGSTIVSTGIAPDTTGHVFKINWDGTHVNFYIDGTRVAQISTGYIPSTSTELFDVIQFDPAGTSTHIQVNVGYMIWTGAK